MAARKSQFQKPLYALPPDVNLSEFDFEPTWQEREWEKYLVAKALYEAEYWAAQHQKLAQIALLIDADKLQAEVANHYAEIDLWWAEQRAKEQEAWRQRELKRLELIGKEIRRDAAQLERLELERRGVIRGRRH